MDFPGLDGLNWLNLIFFWLKLVTIPPNLMQKTTSWATRSAKVVPGGLKLQQPFELNIMFNHSIILYTVLICCYFVCNNSCLP